MERREFLHAAALTSLTATACTSQVGALRRQTPVASLSRVAIMTLSFGAIIKNPFGPEEPARTLDLLDVPQMYADRYGVHNIELQHSHFASTEPAYLRQLLDRVQRSRSRIIQVNAASWGSLLGPSMNLSVPGWTQLHLIDLTKRWVDHAVALGSPRLMMHQGPLPPEVRQSATETFRKVVDYGRSRGVMVTLENSGGGLNWEATAELVKAAGGYTTPDLGNFTDQEAQLRGIRALFPMHSGNAHVKLNPARYDLPTALALMRELGYDGLYSVEAGASVDPDPYIAVQKILDVLLANI